MQVVDDLAADVHRRAVALEGALDDLDRPVDAGAERPRGGEDHLVLATGTGPALERAAHRQQRPEGPDAPERPGRSSVVSEIERMTASGFFGRQPMTQADSMSTATAPEAASASRSPART